MDSTAVKAQKIAPSQFELPLCVSSKPGHLKVRLVYLTHAPKHMRSAMLQNNYGMKPPYTEDTCALLPCRDVFNNLEHFLPVFTRLQFAGVISPDSRLIHFSLLDEDDDTLAYVIS